MNFCKARFLPCCKFNQLMAQFVYGMEKNQDQSFFIETNAGRIQFDWNPLGKLKKIKFLFEKNQNKDDAHKPQRVIASGKIPLQFFKFLDNFSLYLETGKPIGEPQWDILDLSEWSEFQSKVYFAVSKIPFGETRTYRWVSERLRKVSAQRAVGQALRKNPLPVIVPCHRVVSAFGDLGGFMGKPSCDEPTPEILLKKRLIEKEENYLNPRFNFFDSSEDLAKTSLHEPQGLIVFS